MSDSTPQVGGSAVRLYRVAAGCFAEVLTLSPHYGGCWTHWIKGSGGKKGRSLYCRPEGCPSDRHKAERYWKGYAACLLSRPQDKLLDPIVLEITDRTELDLRARWGRGQWWRLTHKPEVKGKHEPIEASYVGRVDLAIVPPAFDVRAVLMHVFHEEHIDLGIANPMPPRVVMQSVPYSSGLMRLNKEEAVEKK
jgi:hypothetical protein